MRLYVRFFFIVIAFGYGTVHSGAQNISAWSLQFLLPEVSVFLVFPEPVEKIEQLLEEERNSHSVLKGYLYAVGIETSINPKTSGQWDTIPGKGYVWRTGIYAENALSLNLFIENYRMQSGMALYVYNHSMRNIVGPFDVRNNANGGILPVQSLPGDTLIIEWNIPIHTSPDNNFTITSIGYGFRDMETGVEMSRLGTAAACNVDINCKSGNYWQRERRAVVRLETTVQKDKSKETRYCTGTLVNQAVDANLKKPYILTAHHCISTPEMAQSTTFVFGYEKSYCGGSTPSLPAGVTGSSLIATKRELDFTLLELPADGVTALHNPYYAGWSASSATPQSITGIHHPQGDVKKISVASSPLVTGTFTDKETDLYCASNAHWIVKRWSEGTTENGSSGSPIFNAEHKIVGTLSGGTATCPNPIDDYYSKFSEQWNKYPNAGESLKPWLDPKNKGVTSLWGYDPVTGYENRLDILGNIGKNEDRILIESGDWGYLTSQNDRNWIGFAEKIRNDTVAKIIGMEVHIAEISEPDVKVRFAVWSGPDLPVTLLYEKETVVTAEFNNYPMHIYIDQPLEITGDFFIGYSLEYNDPQEIFAVYQSEKRPLTGLSTMYIEESNGSWMALDEYVMPPIYSSLGIRALGAFGKEKQLYLSTYKELKIVSQHGNNNIFACFEDPSVTVKFECYDTSGRQMMVKETNRNMVMFGNTAYLQVELDVSNLPPGIYLIRAFDKNKILSGKFVKL